MEAFETYLNPMLNVNGCCFICARNNHLCFGDLDKTFSLKFLFSELDIKLEQVISDLKESSQFKQISLKDDCPVQLCPKCGKIIKRFSQLCQLLEAIKIEMDYSLGVIKEEISCSGNVINLKEDFQESDIVTLAGLQLADAIRKLIVKQCDSKERLLMPKVILERLCSSWVECKENPVEHPESADNLSDIGNDYFQDISESDYVTGDDGSGRMSSLHENVKIKMEDDSKKNDSFTGTSNADASDERHHCIVPGCLRNYKLKKYLVRHIQYDHPKSTYSKPKKSRRAPFDSKYKDKFTVIDKDDMQEFKCNICKMITNSLVSFIKHYKYVHGPKNFKCVECDKAFSARADFIKHWKRRHGKGKNIFKIEGFPSAPTGTAKRESKYKDAFSKNIKDGIEIFKCKFCSKEYNMLHDFTAHYTYTHVRNKE